MFIVSLSLTKNTDILLFLRKGIAVSRHLFDQSAGLPRSPLAQQLGLGWMVIRELCLGHIHAQDVLNVYESRVLRTTSLFKPCADFSASVQDPIFVRTPDDNKASLSLEDQESFR